MWLSIYGFFINITQPIENLFTGAKNGEGYEKVICPNCRKDRRLSVPGDYECAFCDFRFRIDNRRIFYQKMDDCETISYSYFPKKLTTEKLIAFSVVAVALILLGFVISIQGRLDTPHLFVRHIPIMGLHFRGFSVDIVAFSFVFFAAYLVLRIVDHFDERDNELVYRVSSRLCLLVGSILLIAAILFQYIIGKI